MADNEPDPISVTIDYDPANPFFVWFNQAIADQRERFGCGKMDSLEILDFGPDGRGVLAAVTDLGTGDTEVRTERPCPMCGLSPCETRVECAMEAKRDDEN